MQQYLSGSPKTVPYIVSVENGVETLLQHQGTIGIDFACVLVNSNPLDNDEQIYIGFSQGRPYPLETIQNMKRDGYSNEDIGDFCVEYYKNAQLSINREDQVFQATLMALSQSRH